MDSNCPHWNSHDRQPQTSGAIQSGLKKVWQRMIPKVYNLNAKQSLCFQNVVWYFTPSISNTPGRLSFVMKRSDCFHDLLVHNCDSPAEESGRVQISVAHSSHRNDDEPEAIGIMLQR